MQLAEVNVARFRAPLDHPEMAGFVRAFGDVMWLAEKSPGFVWRYRPMDGGVTWGELPGLGRVAVTLSVWSDYESLNRFVRRTAHGLFMGQRRRWFEPIGGFTTALWWVPDGAQPTVEEGLTRLELLRACGPTPKAFSLGLQFGPHD